VVGVVGGGVGCGPNRQARITEPMMTRMEINLIAFWLFNFFFISNPLEWFCYWTRIFLGLNVLALVSGVLGKQCEQVVASVKSLSLVRHLI